MEFVIKLCLGFPIGFSVRKRDEETKEFYFSHEIRKFCFVICNDSLLEFHEEIIDSLRDFVKIRNLIRLN